MKKLILILSIVIHGLMVQAQEDTTKIWKIDGSNKLTIGNIALSNWNAGGENATNFQLAFDYQFNYLKGKDKWDNRAIFLFGANKQGVNDFEKTDDRIDLTSMYGREASKHWYYSLEVNFKSQFIKGFEENTDGVRVMSSNWMAPGYLTITPGMQYSPHENLKVFISPLSSRYTFVFDDSLSSVGAYGVDVGRRYRYELGMYANASYKHDFNDHFGTDHLLRLYSNYLDKPQNIDIDYTGKIYVKATSWFVFDFMLQVIYDHDITITSPDGTFGPRTQLKSVLGAGFTYIFKNY